MSVKITKEEQKAIERLQKAIDKMPKSLWLFSNGVLNVMKYGKDGQAVNKQGDPYAYDTEYCVGEIAGIEADGGDW